MARTKRKKLKMKNKMPVFVLSLLMVVLFFASYTFAKEFLFPVEPILPDETAGELEETIPDFGDRLNFLLLGTDAREGEKVARTDTMILVSVDKDTNRISMLSIPRDTRVNIPGRGMDKINAAYVYGGPKLASKTVSNLLGVPIDYYVLARFEGFKDIVDALGGVDFEVQQNMYYPAEGINLKKGQQRLDGDKALQFVRYRSYPNGDIDRTEQQQRFLKALAEETLQPSNVIKLPKLAYSVNKNVDTNMGLSNMIKLAKAAKGLNDTDIVTQTLPGRFMDINGVSYWHVEPANAKKSVVMLLDGQTSNVIEGRTVVQNDNPAPKQEPKEEPPVQNWAPKKDDDEDEEQPGKQNNTGTGTSNNPVPQQPQQPTQPVNPVNPGDDGGTNWLPPAGGQQPGNDGSGWPTQGS